MLHDENRLRMTRSPEEYAAYISQLTDSQKTALSRIGVENTKFLLKEYIRLLNSESEPMIYITDFMTWMDETMLVYDCNVYLDKRDEEIEKMLRGNHEAEGGKTV